LAVFGVERLAVTRIESVLILLNSECPSRSTIILKNFSMTTVFTLVVGGESSLKKIAPLTVHEVMEAQRAFDLLVYKATKADGGVHAFMTNNNLSKIPYNH